MSFWIDWGIQLTIIIFALIIIVNIVLQSTILPYFNIFGIVPNTALVIVVTISLLRGKYYGSFFGLCTGVVQDILFGYAIGVNGLIYFLMGYMIGTIQKNLDTENKVIPVMCSALSTIFYNFSYFLLMFFLSRNIPIPIMLKNVFSLEILYNSILSIFIYKLFSRFFVVPSLKFKRR